MLSIRSVRAALGGLAVAAMALFAAPAVRADEAPLRIKVSVIQALKEKGPADPALAKIQGELQEAFAGYQGFKRLMSEERELVGDAPVKIDLPNGDSAEFTHTGVEKTAHKLHLTIPTAKVNVDVKAPLRKVFFQAGLKHGTAMLILAMFLDQGGAGAKAPASKP